MQECRYNSHVWENSIVEEPSYTAGAMRCANCHVGHLFEMKNTSDGKIKVGYWIFPADGNMNVSPDVTRWGIATCEGTIKEMKDDGLELIQETPVIGGPRPKALDKHHYFLRSPAQGG